MTTTTLDQIDVYIEQKKWKEALIEFQLKEKTNILLQLEIMKKGLIYFHLQDYEQTFTIYKKLTWEDYSYCAWLRRMVIAPAIKTKLYSLASSLLELILKYHPQSILDLQTYSSVLIRQNKRESGAQNLQKILTIEPKNYSAAAQLIQLKIQDQRLEEAEKLCLAYQADLLINERLLQMALLTAVKVGKCAWALICINNLQEQHHTLEILILAAQIALDLEDLVLAKQLLAKLTELQVNDVRISLIGAKILLAANEDEKIILSMLKKGINIDSKHIQLNNLFAHLALKNGDYTAAIESLRQLKFQLPNNSHTKVMYARALKFSGQYAESANEMLEVLKLLPDSVKWKRYTAAALVQADRHQEAELVYQQTIASRNKLLLSSFEEGMNQLSKNTRSVTLPKARFDWLWKIVDPKQHINEKQKLSLEDEVKFSVQLDHYLLDWLECRPQQADEAMCFFEDLSEKSSMLESLLGPDTGIILASAHIGCLYAGPLALDLLGLPYKWLASTPNISSLPYNQTLISTSSNTEVQVVRQVIKNLREGKIITIAVDGALNPAAPRVDFEGEKVTYSDFAAKMAYRCKVPSFFAIPYWENDRFVFKLEPLATPVPNEALETFCTRWTEDYFRVLKQFLIEHPNNARLSGGIWRSIR